LDHGVIVSGERVIGARPRVDLTTLLICLEPCFEDRIARLTPVVSSADVRGPWSRGRVHEHLDRFTGPVRLSFLDEDGYPRVVSVWFTRMDDSLRCATQEDSMLARRVGRDGRVGFEVAGDQPPYQGVRGWGTATIEPEDGPVVLEALLDRFVDEGDPLASWLRSRSDTEVALTIRPATWVTWDYSGRMSEGD
jgi:hypothetical protein